MLSLQGSCQNKVHRDPQLGRHPPDPLRLVGCPERQTDVCSILLLVE